MFSELLHKCKQMCPKKTTHFNTEGSLSFSLLGDEDSLTCNLLEEAASLERLKLKRFPRLEFDSAQKIKLHFSD